MIQFDRPDLKAAASPPLIERGCVNVIGLDALRDKAGERWLKIRSGIYTRLESILRQRLGPADFFVPLDDVSYLVTMPAADPADAKVACLRAAYDLYAEYLGKVSFNVLHLYRVSHGSDDTMTLERIAPEELKELADRAEASASKAQAQGQGEAARSIATQERHLLPFEPRFLPVWDAKNEAITLYTCVPQKLAFRHAPAMPVSIQDLPAKERVKVEVACVRRGVEMLAKRMELGERFLMGFRVGFETLSVHSARVEFTSACRELSSDFRQYLVLTMTDVPMGVPHSRLSELMMALKPYARAVMSEVPFSLRDCMDYKGIGLQAIGLNFKGQRLSNKEMDDEILRLAAAAKRLSVSTFLSGVSQSSALRSARRAGIHFMTGKLIAPARPEPGPMKRLHWNEVISEARVA